MTKISVVTAVYNKGDTLAQALDSVLAQTHPDVETVLVDGGSGDETQRVLARYRDRLDVFVSERDHGIYDALNKGIALSSGEVIGFLHADDLFADKRVLERVARAFENPAVEAVYGDLEYVRHDDVHNVVRLWRSGEFQAAKLQRGWMPPHPTFYVRRSVYERLGGFDTNFRIAADYDCMLRMLGAGVRTVYIPEILVRMRTGGISNRSLSNILRKSREDVAAARRNGVGGLRTIALKNLTKISQLWRRR